MYCGALNRLEDSKLLLHNRRMYNIICIITSIIGLYGIYVILNHSTSSDST